MPIYDFDCYLCGDFEKRVAWDTQMTECPECGGQAPKISRYRTFGIIYDKDMYNGRKAKDPEGV